MVYFIIKFLNPTPVTTTTTTLNTVPETTTTTTLTPVPETTTTTTTLDPEPIPETTTTTLSPETTTTTLQPGQLTIPHIFYWNISNLQDNGDVTNIYINNMLVANITLYNDRGTFTVSNGDVIRVIASPAEGMQCGIYIYSESPNFDISDTLLGIDQDVTYVVDSTVGDLNISIYFDLPS